MENFIREIADTLGSTPALTTAYLIVGGLIVIMSVVCLVLEIRVWLRYSKANRSGISTQMTGMEAARYTLDRSGLTHVQVRRSGFFWELLFGNFYDIASKTVYLRSWLGKIDTRRSVTSVALGVQKAAVARLCEEGDQQARVRNRLVLFGAFGPILFIPIVLIGGIVDLLVMKDITMISYICLGVGGLLAAAGFIVTMLNIPVEKRANALALQMMEEYGLADAQELEMMKKVYDAYILSYIAQFILEILRVVQWVLEIIIKFQNKKN